LIRKVVLIINLPIVLKFHCSANWQHPALIQRFPLLEAGAFKYFVFTPCCANRDGKGKEIAAEKTGQDIK
jgi:hypothetical protein